MTALAEESREIALDLYRLFGDLDRARWRAEANAALEERLASARTRLERLLADYEKLQQHEGPLFPRLAELRHSLEHAPRVEEGRKAWLAFRARVQPSYEAMAASLRASAVQVPSLRPTNYTRSIFHLASALAGLAIIELVPSWTAKMVIAAAVAASAWTMELSRRHSARINAVLMKLFGPVAHPHEVHRVNSATWYATALVGLSLTGQTIPAAVALVALGVGDPAAALVGRRVGRLRLFNGRTVEGTLAFVAVSLVASAALLLIGHQLSLGAALLIAASGAVAGAAAELFARGIDDNLAIPIVACGGAALAMALL